MKKMITLFVEMVVAVALLCACGGKNATNSGASQNTPVANAQPAAEASQEKKLEKVKINIKVGDKSVTALLDNNATTQALVKKMPVTLPMLDLYGREMCYRFGGGALPTDHLQSDGYQVGDIAYWPPRGSLVILYAQNGEHFERQHLGHIDSGIELFNGLGDTNVTFKLAK